MAKTFLLAKSFYRYCTLIFRDHGTSRNLAAGYPAGYSFRPSAGVNTPPSAKRAIVTHLLTSDEFPGLMPSF
jgi:hypothetical protein